MRGKRPPPMRTPMVRGKSPLQAAVQSVSGICMIYSSGEFYVVEYLTSPQRSYEIFDKLSQRVAFVQGDLAKRFADALEKVVVEDPSIEAVDEFIGDFDMLFSTNPMLVH